MYCCKYTTMYHLYITNIQQVCDYVIYWSIEEPLLTSIKPHVHNDIEVVYVSLYTQLYTYTKWLCFQLSLHKIHTVAIGEYQITYEVNLCYKTMRDWYCPT